MTPAYALLSGEVTGGVGAHWASGTDRRARTIGSSARASIATRFVAAWRLAEIVPGLGGCVTR
jgi:hypothetical protein